MNNDNRIKVEKSFWNRIAANYDNIIEAKYNNIISKATSCIKESDRVLEIGVGTGLVAFEIAKFADEVTGIDLSEKMIEQAEKKKKEREVNNIQFKVGDAYCMPFTDNFFDCIVCCNTLHIVQRPELMLKEIRRVLKPSGRLICVTYTYVEATSIRARIFLTVMRVLHRIGVLGCLHKYSANDIKQLVDGAGYVIGKEEFVENEKPACLFVEAFKLLNR